jgi:very-short-patch-repair endonuclease
VKKSEAERLLLDALNAVGLDPETGYKFCHRKWEFDFAFVEPKLAIEIDGSGPGHNSDGAVRNDCSKRNAAVEFGWRVLRYPARSVVVNSRRAMIVAQIQRIWCGEADGYEYDCVLEDE